MPKNLQKLPKISPNPKLSCPKFNFAEVAATHANQKKFSLCRWQVEKRYLLEVERVVNRNQFLQDYLNDIHKSSFSLKQFFIQFF